jgi:hypothetical protein
VIQIGGKKYDKDTHKPLDVVTSYINKVRLSPCMCILDVCKSILLVLYCCNVMLLCCYVVEKTTRRRARQEPDAAEPHRELLHRQYSPATLASAPLH